MRKISIFLSLLFAFVTTTMAEGIIKLSDFNPNKCYTVSTTERGGWSVKADGSQFCSTNDANLGTNVDATNTQNQFAVLTVDNENYYLFSVHANKFVKRDRTLVKGAGDALEFADAGDGERVRVNFKGIADSYINLGGSNQMTIDSWSTMDVGNKVKFVEAGDFDPAAAIEMLQNNEAETEVVKLFGTTTVVDGQFAKGTPWYTLQIAGNGFVIADHGTADHIALEDVKSDVNADAQLWAFVGDNTNGYKLYNKQAGATKVLAAPTAMLGNTGASSYPILVDAEALPSGYTDMWQFTTSSDLGSGDTYFYMYEKGYSSNKVNNRDNKLAFWNGGADAGSTLNIRLGQAEYSVTALAGEWTETNAAGTWASGWKSTAVPHVCLSETQNRKNIAGYNDNGDLQLFTCLANATVNGVHVATYSLSIEDDDYVVAGYSFDFVSSGTADVTVTPNGGSAVTANSSEAATVSVENSDENPVLTFDVTSGSNMFANTSNFTVKIVRKAPVVEPSVDIFVTKKGGIPYRIPAITTAKNGNLIAVSDYRHCGADIGYGRIDLHARISEDNGANWGDIKTIIEGKGYGSADKMYVGFGDAAIVADRESDRVLMLSCAGDITFQSGTRSHHQNIARFYSDDNGATWSAPDDIAEAIYSKWDNSNHGPVMAMFVGSGKIHQSRYVKVNDYYRLYCAVLLKNKNGVYTNFVLYSDDFGGTWDVLGGVNTAAIPSGGDEPKVEELPNGNVVISSRISGGRDFNIFTFTDKEAATGSWGTRATSNASNNGVVALGNSTNGEILMVPAVRNEDGENVWIALQSVPLGSGRTNVGIYYKELASKLDYNTPANFAKDWDGRHQSSYMGSAYSTMCIQSDSTIAFLYEESTYGADYTIVYKNYTLEQITDGAYSISGNAALPDTDEEESEETKALIEDAKAVLAYKGVGTPANEARAALKAALAAAEANPTAAAGSVLSVALDAYYAETEIILPEAGKVYTFTAVWGENEYYIYNNNGTLAVAARGEEALPEAAQFVCEYDETADYKFQFKTADGAYYLAYPTLGGKSWLDGESLTGLEAESSNVTKFNVNKILSGGNVAATNEALFGLIQMDGWRGYDNGKNIDSYGPIVVKHSAQTFDGAGDPYYNENFTSAIRIEDVEGEPIEPTVITSVDQLSNNRVYTIVSSDLGRGGMFAGEGASMVDMCGVTYNSAQDCHSIARDITDPRQQFAFVSYEGSFYLYSVSEKKFVAKNGKVNKLTDEAPYDYVVVEPVTESTFALMLNGTHYMTASPGWCSNAERNTCIQTTLTSHSSSDGWDDGAWFTITEVGSFDATEALAMLAPVVEPLEVVSITPADGETVEKLEQIVVTFNAPVTLDETKSISLVAVEENADVTPIEAYAGSWKMASLYPGYDEMTYYATGTVEVIDYQGTPALLCKNFADYDPAYGYDDSFIMLYNSEDGSITLPTQQVGDFYYEGASYQSALLLTNSMRMEIFNGKLIGNIVDGNIVFENSAENENTADSFMFYAPELGTLTYFNSLTWTPAEAAAAPAKAPARNKIAIEGVKSINVAPIAKSKMNRADENVVNVVSASINPDDETQLIITVNEALANGTYKLSIEAGAVVTAQGATNEAIICTYYLNDPTGVEEVKAENGEVKAIYDLTGRKVAEPVKGIYIIDGKKVLVK